MGEQWEEELEGKGAVRGGRGRRGLGRGAEGVGQQEEDRWGEGAVGGGI